LKIDREQWQSEQAFEQGWWDDCRNTFGEQAKHITYARKMGLLPFNDGGRWPLINTHGMKILDIGGGPVSMLLECQGLERAVVVDPCRYPQWTVDRYKSVGIELCRWPAEDFSPDEVFDEVWCYNVLQHTFDPEAIVAMMRRSAKLIRIFEWIDFPPSPGHPHMLTWDTVCEWLPPVRWEAGDWLASSEVYWDLTLTRSMYGGRAIHGYVGTGL
jgi:hypothetical protein